MLDFYPCTPYSDTPAVGIAFSYRIKQADSENDSAICVVSEPGGLLMQSVTTLHSGGAGCEAGIMSDDAYDFTGKYCSVELVRHDAGPDPGASIVSSIMLHKDLNNRIIWGPDNYQRMGVFVRTGGGAYSEKFYGGWPLTYNPAVHRFLLVREVSGTILFDYSTDGLAWTTLYSMANPFALTAIKIFLNQRTGVAAGSFPAGLTTQFRGFASDVS